MNLEIRDARIDDVEIVAWTVLTALDMEIHNLDKFIKSCSANDTLYSWRNAVVATVDGQAVGCLIGYEVFAAHPINTARCVKRQTKRAESPMISLAQGVALLAAGL